jgi:hypothetical protein
MTTIWNQHLFPRFVDGSLNLTNRHIGLMLLYTYVTPTNTSPDDATLLAAAPGFQELDAGTGYTRVVEQSSQTTTGSVTSVVVGSDYALTLNKPTYVVAGIWYVDTSVDGPVAGFTNPWIFISTDMFGNVVSPGAVVGTAAVPKVLFSYTPRPGAASLVDPLDTTTNWTTAGTIVPGGQHGNGLQLTPTANNMVRNLPVAAQTASLIVGFAYKAQQLPAGTGASPSLAHFRSDTGATLHNALAFTGTGAFTVTNGAGPVLLTTGPHGIVVNTWAYVELKVVLSATVGSVAVAVNGVTIGAVNNVDTWNPAGTKTVYDQIIIAAWNNPGNVTIIDDVYINPTVGAGFSGPINASQPPAYLAGTVDIALGTIVQSPGPSTWESARLQHIYLYPQRVNYIPNPSFEDVGMFGWRGDQAITRVAGGVDSPSNNYGHTAGKVVESVSIPSQGPMRFSAFVRNTTAAPGAATVTLKLMCLDDTSSPLATIAGKTRPIYQTWTRVDDILIPADLSAAVIPRIEASVGPLDFDLVLLEAGEALHDYFDGDYHTGWPGDLSWQGQEAQSYSMYYTNRNATAARLFGAYLYPQGQVTLPCLVQDWVPTGTQIMTHWDVLSPVDTRHVLKDWNPKTFTP